MSCGRIQAIFLPHTVPGAVRETRLAGMNEHLEVEAVKK